MPIVNITNRFSTRNAWIRRVGYCLTWALVSVAASVWAQDDTNDSNAPSDDPIYIEGNEPFNVFDEDRPAVRGLIERAAKHLSERRRRDTSDRLAAIQDVIAYDYDLAGSDEAEIRDEAIRRALRSAAARLYMMDYILMGRDLLGAYLWRNQDRFIVNISPLSDLIPLSGDRIGQRVRVRVDLKRMYADMDEKRFIVRPALRPSVAVYVFESNEGEEDFSIGGRARLETGLQQHLYQIMPEAERKAGFNRDLTFDADALKAARLDVQRHGADILITGEIATNPAQSTEEIYYDYYEFRKVEARLSAYRVDTGDLIVEVTDSYSAAGETRHRALSDAMETLIARMSKELALKIERYWRLTVLAEGDCRLMLSGVTRSEADTFFALLRNQSPEIQIHEKAAYGDVIVVNVIWPGVRDGQLEEFLALSNEPQFDVHPLGDNRFDLDRR